MITRSLLGACALLVLTTAAAHADNTVWLSSLDLSKATQGFGKPQADKSIDGHPLTLNGHTFAHGFGTHSPGMLAVELDGGATRFNATVGIDDEVGGGRGHAEFEVLGDGGKLLWRSGVMHQGDPAKTVDLDLTGMKRIILRVTTGGTTYDFDHDDWADARFTVVGAQPRTFVWKPADTIPVIWMGAPDAAPKINPPFVVGVYPGTPLLWTVPASGTRPLSFSARRLPAGLRMNATGTISGTAPKAGDYPVQVLVMNRAGRDLKMIHILAGPNLARTPPMGWNSYDAYGSNVNENQVLANARYLQTNMQPVGWDTVVVDYRWYDPASATAPDNGAPGETLTMDEFGRLLPPANRFPSAAEGKGFKGLADIIHGMGLKFGIHIMRGIPRNAVKQNLPVEGSTFHAADAANTGDTCGWCADMYGVRGATPAGQAYYDSIVRLYAAWGVDYVKMDDTSSPYHTDEIEAVHNAILKCGRSIVYSLSPGETPVEQGAHVAGHANLWRISGDFWDNWNALDHTFLLGTRWHPFAAPGHWPDADMLPVGHISLHGRPVGPDRQTNFTKNEQMTLLSLWSLLPSPLMVGANLPDNDAWTLALLTNPEVMAVNQDGLGAAGGQVSSSEDGLEVWSRKLADGSVAVGLFNRGDFGSEPITATWTALGLTGRQTVRDLWQRKDLGVFDQQFSLAVPAHGAALLRVRGVR